MTYVLSNLVILLHFKRRLKALGLPIAFSFFSSSLHFKRRLKAGEAAEIAQHVEKEVAFQEKVERV